MLNYFRSTALKGSRPFFEFFEKDGRTHLCKRSIATAHQNLSSPFKKSFRSFSAVAREHATRVRVEWRDLDAMNHVNNCTFFAYFENARIQVFRDQLGLDMSLEPSGVAPVIAHTECKYLRQVRLPDELEIRTVVEDIDPDRAQYKHRYECFSLAQEKVVAIGSATIVMVNFDGKAASRAPLSEEFVRKLKS